MITFVDLSNEYNQAVKWASDLVNETEELRPYIKTVSTLSFFLECEPNPELIKQLQDKTKESLLKSKIPFILKDLKYKNTEIIYKEDL